MIELANSIRLKRPSLINKTYLNQKRQRKRKWLFKRCDIKHHQSSFKSISSAPLLTYSTLKSGGAFCFPLCSSQRLSLPQSQPPGLQAQRSPSRRNCSPANLAFPFIPPECTFLLPSPCKRFGCLGLHMGWRAQQGCLMYLLVTSADKYPLLQVSWLWAANHGRDGLMLTRTSAIIFSINCPLSHPALTSLLISGCGWLPRRAGGGLGRRLSSVTSRSAARLSLVPKAPLYVPLHRGDRGAPSPRAGPPPPVPVNYLPLTLHPRGAGWAVSQPSLFFR